MRITRVSFKIHEPFEPHPDSIPDKNRMVSDAVNMARKCVAKYTNYMQSPDYPEAGFVADASKLPVGKEFLKTALIILISTSNDNGAAEQLKAAYISLAYFQHGVGSDNIMIDSTARAAKSAVPDDGENHEHAYQHYLNARKAKQLLNIVTMEKLQLSDDIQSLKKTS